MFYLISFKDHEVKEENIMFVSLIMAKAGLLIN